MEVTQYCDARSQQTTPRGPQSRFPPTPAASSEAEEKQKNVFSPDLPVDYRLLLLSLVDQYINEARAMSAYVVYVQQGAELKDYHQLMATAFCCFETVLQLSWLGTRPREEPTIRLRYAQCLYEETENYHDAEAVLSKGIPYCEHNRLLDLKYSMQHLMARIMFKYRPSAAVKYLETLLKEAVTCEHTVWIYALRFLRISFSIEQGSTHELRSVVVQTNAVVELARRSGDKTVSALASIIKAYICLRVRDPDSLIDAQQAIASIRANLMSLPDKGSPQLNYALAMIDLACSLDPHDYDASKIKFNAMRQILDDEECHKQTRSDGSFDVVLERTVGGSLTTETGGIFTKDANDRDCIRCTWLTYADLYALGFLLGASAVYPAKRATPVMIQNALAAVHEAYSLQQTNKSESIAEANVRAHYRRDLTSQALQYKMLMACETAQWTEAEQTLSTIYNHSSKLSTQSRTAIIYLKGVIAQATGAFPEALRAFSSPLLKPSDNRSTGYFQTELSILAALNTLLIVYMPDHAMHSSLPGTLARLREYFSNKGGQPTLPSSDPHLVSAWEFIQTLIPSSQGEKKQHLQASLTSARNAKNQQLLILCMIQMYESFKKGIMGEKSVQTAIAALKFAKDAGSSTWICVADGILRDASELEGLKEQARTAVRDAESHLGSLPGQLGVVNHGEVDAALECA